MAKPIANTWTGIIHYPTQDPTHSSNDPNQKLVDETLLRLLNDLKPNLEPLIQSLEVKLSLVQSDRSRRLERGINESGLIGPDYGKLFTGYYFDSLHVTVKTQPETK